MWTNKCQLLLPKNTLYTRFLSVNVSKREYIAFNIDTTSIGVILLQISVNVTTSENKIETVSNIWNNYYRKGKAVN